LHALNNHWISGYSTDGEAQTTTAKRFSSTKKLGASSAIADRFLLIDTYEDITKPYQITKKVITIKDNETNEVLGVVTTFYFNGAYMFLLPKEVSGGECPQTISTTERPIFESFLKQIFIKIN
jgi:hypothetical protein